MLTNVERIENYALLILHSLMLFTCVFGNFLVLTIVYQKRSMRTVTNLLLANLSISQLLFGIFVMPLIILKKSNSEGHLFNIADEVCSVLGFIYFTTCFANSFILISIAFDRFWVLWLTRKREYDKIVLIYLTFVCWFLSIILAALESTIVRQDLINETSFRNSSDLSDDEKKRKEQFNLSMNVTYPDHLTIPNKCSLAANQPPIFSFINALLQWLLPFVLISIFYSLVAFKLSRVTLDNTPRMQIKMPEYIGLSFMSGKDQPPVVVPRSFYASESSFTTNISDSYVQKAKREIHFASWANVHSQSGQIALKIRLKIDRRKKRTVIMLATVVALFLISWGPLHLYIILTRLGDIKFSERVRGWLQCLAYSNIWYNPLLYCLFNKQYLKQCLRIIFALNPMTNLKKIWSCLRKNKSHSGPFKLYIVK